MEAEGVNRTTQFRNYLTDVRAEMRKVVWPTRKETTSTTLVVLGMVVMVSLFLWAVDSLLSLIVKAIVN